MESFSSKGDRKMNNGSTDSSTISYPLNDQINHSGPGYNADEECSNIKESKFKTIFQNGDLQKNKIIYFRGNLYLKIRTMNVSTSSGKRYGRKLGGFYGCDTCRMEELSKFLLSNDEKSKTSPKMPSCELENKCAKWVETTFTVRYGREFTEDLIFAIDIAMLARSVNGLAFQHIHYPTINKAPDTPFTEVIDKAYILIWHVCEKEFKRSFDLAINGLDVTYENFQNLILMKTKDWEEAPYKAKGFLIHTAMVMQWAIYAEKMGVSQAYYFFPLVICRTIHRLRIWEHITETFWADLNEAANFLVDSCSQSFLRV